MMQSRGSTVKLQGWTPQAPPAEDEEMQTYRTYIVDAVRMLYAINKANTCLPFKPDPIYHGEVYALLKNRIGALLLQKKWRFYGYVDRSGNVHIRPRETVDRRTRECASLEYGAQIVAVKAGYFIPKEEAELKSGEGK